MVQPVKQVGEHTTHTLSQLEEDDGREMKLFLYLTLCIWGIEGTCDSGYYRPFILLPCKPCQEEDVVYFGNNIQVRISNFTFSSTQEMPFKSEILLDT